MVAVTWNAGHSAPPRLPRARRSPFESALVEASVLFAVREHPCRAPEHEGIDARHERERWHDHSSPGWMSASNAAISSASVHDVVSKARGASSSRSRCLGTACEGAAASSLPDSSACRMYSASRSFESVD